MGASDWGAPARLRATFDEAAELYRRARPCYPPALVDDLVRLAGIGPAGRVLEIGCGTGQMTLPIAERGCEIVAVELGPALAAVARRTLAPFPSVRIEVAAFEQWTLLEEPFSAVVSATAFHWIDPTVRVAKAADALHPGGALATVATHHIEGGDESFFAEVQSCYERWMPGTPPGLRLPRAEQIPMDDAELERSGRFERAVFRRYEWERTYSTAEYLELLLTYSGHRALPPDPRSGLLDCVARLIDARYGGRIRKRHMNELRVARRTP